MDKRSKSTEMLIKGGIQGGVGWRQARPPEGLAHATPSPAAWGVVTRPADRAPPPRTGTEQHQEHLHMAHDNLHCMYMAEQVAKAMAPEVVVATPLNIGVSEHHMETGPGTLTVRPEIFCEFVFDVCDSLVRSGITNILIMNGHGGNVKPMMYRIEEYRDRLSNIFNNAKMAGGGVGYRGPPGARRAEGGGPGMPEPGALAQSVNLRFQSYWDIYDPDFIAEHVSAAALCAFFLQVQKLHAQMVAGAAPGHACEYETSTMLHLFPERVSVADIDPSRPESHASAEKGAALVGPAIEGNVQLIRKMIDGDEFEQPPVTFRDGDAIHMLSGDVIVRVDAPVAARL